MSTGPQVIKVNLINKIFIYYNIYYCVFGPIVKRSNVDRVRVAMTTASG